MCVCVCVYEQGPWPPCCFSRIEMRARGLGIRRGVVLRKRMCISVCIFDGNVKLIFSRFFAALP